MELSNIGFKELVTVYGHVWQRILPHDMDKVTCTLNAKTHTVTLTIHKPDCYAGCEVIVPLTNVAYYQVSVNKPKRRSKK